MATIRLHRGWLLGLFVLLLAVLPWLVQNTYILSIMIFIGLYTILTVGLCLLMGYAGQISLGHAAFYGLGAYTSAIATAKGHLSPWLGILLSLILTAGIALLIARPIFSLKGHYLAMATLGFGYIVYIFFTEASGLTGGPSGLTGIPYLSIGGWWPHRSASDPWFVFDSDLEYYYLVWGFTLVVLLAALNIVNARMGRALRAVHGSEIAAQAMGINVEQLKTKVFAVSALFAGLSGSLYAHYITFVNPSPFGFHFSVMLLVMASVGGVATIWGAPFGAAFVVALSEVLRAIVPRLLPHASGEVEITVFGLLLMLVMIFMPEGVVQRLSAIVGRRHPPRSLVHSLLKRLGPSLKCSGANVGGHVERANTPD